MGESRSENAILICFEIQKSFEMKIGSISRSKIDQTAVIKFARQRYRKSIVEMIDTMRQQKLDLRRGEKNHFEVNFLSNQMTTNQRRKNKKKSEKRQTREKKNRVK